MIAVRLLRDGGVIRETVFARLPVTIGRGAESDFVVVDPTVSHAHARLEEGEEGAVLLRDLGSRNGIHVGPRLQGSYPVEGSLRCRLGRAELEVLVVGEADTQELALGELRRLNQRRGFFDHARQVLLGVAGWLAYVMMAPSFWSPWREDRAVSLLFGGLGALVALPGLALAAVIGLGAVGRRVRVGDTLQALCRLVWLWPAFLLVSYSSYYLLPVAAHAVARSVLQGLVVVASVLQIVSLGRRGPGLRFRLVWLGVAAGVYAGVLALGRQSQLAGGEPDTDYHVQAPVLGRMGPSAPLDAYLARLSRTAEAASREAGEIEARQRD